MIIRTTLMTMEVKNPVTRQPYKETSDVSKVVAGFLDRCKAKGIVLNWKGGRKLGLQRWLRSSWEILDRYGKQTAAPALLAFQKKHGVKLTLLDVGNFDEAQVSSQLASLAILYLLYLLYLPHLLLYTYYTYYTCYTYSTYYCTFCTYRASLHAQVDLCEFAEKGNFLVLQWFGNNVVVPFEQSPHITLKWGFVGRSLMVCMLIKIGNGEASAPHPYHCQLLKSSRTLTLAQSTNGWTNVGITSAFLKLQYDCSEVPYLGPHRPEDAAPDAPLVTHPKVLNFDGHAAHIYMYNDQLKAELATNTVLGLSPPAHTSATPPLPRSASPAPSRLTSPHATAVAWLCSRRRCGRSCAGSFAAP